MVPFSVGLGPQRGCQIAPPTICLKFIYHKRSCNTIEQIHLKVNFNGN